MDIKKYTKLTGNTVSSDEEAKFNATIRRTKAMLETLLGYTLAPSDLYNELGKAQNDCACPNVDTSNLLEPDEAEGVYKLFTYNKNDKFLFVDPFKEIYSVKLVYVEHDSEFVTVKTLKNVKPQFGRDGIGKYIENCQTCACECDCDGCVQLAVEADWLDCYPDDILYLWADMIDYELDCNKNYKSESVDGHSWSKTDDAISRPETLPQNVLLLKRYAGPYGSVAVMPT